MESDDGGPRRRDVIVAPEREGLSVIVAPDQDKLSEAGSDELLGGALRLEPAYQTLTAVNGRLTPPGFDAGSSYATLTPLLPLPPISTVSDKFAYHGGPGSFTVIQNNQCLNLGSPYLPSMGLSPGGYGSPGLARSPLSPPGYSQEGLSPHKSLSPASYDSAYQRELGGRRSPLSPLSGSLHSPPPSSPPAPQQLLPSPSPPPAPSPQPLLGKQILTTASISDAEEINTKDLAQRISAELKRYSIPQAIFAQRVLCRSQGTLSDLLRNPKPWSKLKSGRETFRRMWKWLQEPEFQRMSALRLADCQDTARCSDGGNVNTDGAGARRRAPERRPGAPPAPQAPAAAPPPPCFPYDCGGRYTAAQIPQRGSCKRKEEVMVATSQDLLPSPKKPRLVFTDLQRRTLQAIFKETKRPSKEMQVTIARQLGLEPTTVGNFFMNARRRSMDKWKDDDAPSSQGSPGGSNNNGLLHDDDLDLEDPDQDLDDQNGDLL